ncbi:UNVERIFIED_CONTAM: hypothetical protein FKN15_030172 [Acipenser sinensis]
MVDSADDPNIFNTHILESKLNSGLIEEMRLEQSVNGFDLKDSSGGDEGNNKKKPELTNSDNEEYGSCNRKCLNSGLIEEMRLEQSVNGFDLKDSSGGDEGNNKKKPELTNSDNEEYGSCNRKCVYEMREWDSITQDSEDFSKDFKQKGAKMVDPCSFRYDEDSPPMAPFFLLEREESCVTDDDMLKLELMTCDDSEDECSSSINHTVIKIAEAAIENRSPLPEVLPEVVSFKDSSNIEGNVEEGKVFSNPSTVEVNERACNFINGTHEESDLFHGLELQEKKILNINTNATVIESSVKLLSKSEGLKREQANFFEQQKEVKEKGIEADLSPLDGDIEECGSWAMDLTELFKGSSNEECNKQEAHQKNSVKTCQKSNTVEEKLLFETVDKTSDSYIVHQKKDLCLAKLMLQQSLNSPIAHAHV